MSRVWYFAYGSNMQSATFRGRRGVEFTRALPAECRGWRLVFDKPPLIPIGESYANIVPDEAGPVTGVLYEIGPEDLAHIELTEGVAIGNYERVRVEARPLPLRNGPSTSSGRAEGSDRIKANTARAEPVEARCASLSTPSEPAGVVHAHCLASDRRDPSLEPSHRYMDLLIEGAIEHGLPESWVAFLRKVPSRPESPEAIRARPLVDAVLARRH